MRPTRGDDLEDVIGFARRAVALGHFGAGRDFTLELLDAAFVVAGQVNVRERADMEPELLAVEEGGVALDHARLLHVLDAAPARRAGEADLIGDLLHGAARVELQQAKDFLRKGIEGHLRLQSGYNMWQW